MFDTDTGNLMRRACSWQYIKPASYIYNNPVADIFRRSETIARYSGHQTRRARGTQRGHSIAKASMAYPIADRRMTNIAADSWIELALLILINRNINFPQR